MNPICRLSLCFLFMLSLMAGCASDATKKKEEQAKIDLAKKAEEEQKLATAEEAKQKADLAKLEEAKVDKARNHVKDLTAAVIHYKAQHNGPWPQTLEELLQKDEFGGPYLSKAEDLMDPWGRFYQYDVSGNNNNGTQPDIWCDMPNDQGRVCNWSRKIIGKKE